MGQADRVLVVDDEPVVADLLLKVLGRSGFEVTSVRTAEEAIEALAGSRFDGVVTDKNLPGKSGLELLRHIGEHHPHTARVMITGFPNLESVLEAIRAGADDYILKPFDSIVLVAERVRVAIGHHRTELERAALAAKLREMQASLNKSATATFQKMTELELLQNVLELRLEDATAELKARVSSLEAEVGELGEERLSLAKTLRALADEVADESVQRRLRAEAEILGQPRS